MGNSTSSSQQPRAVQIQGPVLEPKQRLARWKVVTLKVLMVLETFALKNRTLAALGTDAYKRIFHRAREEDRQSGTQTLQQRMINGELVGKPLKAGEGVPTVDPQMCNHPTSEMKRRGNKTKWWTCNQCKSRWERIIPEFPQGIPTDRELMLSGIHAGKTFLHILETEHQYTHWVRLTAETNPEGAEPQIYRLAAYLARKEQMSAEGYEEEEENELDEQQMMDEQWNQLQAREDSHDL
jgi:hypothetical protein